MIDWTSVAKNLLNKPSDIISIITDAFQKFINSYCPRIIKDIITKFLRIVERVSDSCFIKHLKVMLPNLFKVYKEVCFSNNGKLGFNLGLGFELLFSTIATFGLAYFLEVGSEIKFLGCGLAVGLSIKFGKYAYNKISSWIPWKFW